MLAALAALVLSLAAFSLDGHRLLGLTPAAVRAALGPPTRVERYPRRLDLVYGSRFEVVTTGTAWSVAIFDPQVREPLLGLPLALAPRALEARVRARTTLREARRYRCDAKGCFGTFFSRGGTRRLIYGLSGGRRYLGLQVWPLP